MHQSFVTIPPAPKTRGDIDVSSISLTLKRQPVANTTAVFAAVCYILHCTVMFAYITQIPGISLALFGKCKIINTANLDGCFPLCPGAGAWLLMTGAYGEV